MFLLDFGKHEKCAGPNCVVEDQATNTKMLAVAKDEWVNYLLSKLD